MGIVFMAYAYDFLHSSRLFLKLKQITTQVKILCNFQYARTGPLKL